jgi:O-antigen/teichoic acid export membrane protein
LIAGYGYASPLAGVLVGYVIIDLRRFRKSWFFPASKEKIKGKEILFDYALPYFTGLIAGLVFSNFQIVLLASLQGQYVTGGYSISFLIASLISIIPNVLSQALFPIISMLSVGKKIKKQAYLLNLVLRYAVFIMLPATIFLIFFSKPILLLLRSEYLEVSNLLSILAVASVFFGLGNLFLSSLYAVGKTKLNRNIWIVSSLIFLIINPILIKLYSAQGLAISYLLSSLFFLILGYYFINKVLTLKVDWKNLSKLLFSSVLFLPFLYVADIMQLDLIIKIAFTILGGIVYLLVLVPLKFYQRDEVKILIFLGKKLPLFKNFLFKLASFLSKYVS